MTTIAIDARMALSSGIGTVIANISRRLIAGNPDWRFFLLGDESMLHRLDWASAPNTVFVNFTAPIHSIREQLEFPVSELRDSDLFWSPNYNIPFRWDRMLVVTVHDLAHLVLPEMRRSFSKQVYARAMFGQVRRRADAIVFVSQFSRNEFYEYVGQPCGRSSVIPGGVDESWFHVASRAKPARPYILFVGNVKPHKNLHRLLDAYAKVKDAIPHDLRIVGRKEGFITGDPGVERRVDAFGGRVAFLGQVSQSALRQFYAEADALIFPSLYEGFGLPALEAMAAECPVLTSRTASLPEVCQDGALYCDPMAIDDIAEKIRRITEDKELRQILRNRGLARARSLNWDTSTEAYRSLIHDLLGRNASGPTVQPSR